VVVAVPASGDDSTGATSLYVVQLVQAPVATYGGGTPGYAATKPAKGKKMDEGSSAAQSYAGYLNAKHSSALEQVGGADKVYDYTAVFNGFAAQLTDEQASKLELLKDVVVVEKAENVSVDATATTGSSDAFLHLSDNGGLWDSLGGVSKGGLNSGAGEDVVFGDVDGGYWPENPAFSDRKVDGSNGNNYPHKVTGFSGICQEGEAFPASTCNGKVIAARYFVAGMGAANLPDYEYLSPRDYGGHGSHTASTAAGNYGVSATGDAAGFGTVSGIAPRARIAVYKACWVLPNAASGSCNSADTTAAINQAAIDGVDVINYSISGTTTAFTNSVEVSFLNAAAANVFVTASAGNENTPTSGPTVAHPSPWIMTTAAGTHNRDGQGTLTIDGVVYNGSSSAAQAVTGSLITGAEAKTATASVTDATLCVIGALDPAKAAGKIVLCDRGVNARIDKSLAVKTAGGIGMVMVNPSANSINADLHFVPTIHLNSDAYVAVHTAADAHKTATISQGTIVFNAPAPFTASFSSRGPLAAGGGDILKPDIIAPGQDILAAVAPPGNHGRDFDLYSGTSMSSPHIAGVALLLKQAHPDWSPMMIKSAMMTTAYQANDYSPFNWGAGHVDPNKAVDPGLVYDSNLTDWLAFLKGQKLYTGPGATLDASDLNSASIAIGDMAGSQAVPRTVTSVGSASETYTFSYSGLAGLSVVPSASSFTIAPGASSTYNVTFTRTTAPLNAYVSGFIVWTGSKGHVVKQVVAIQPVKFAAPVEVTASGTSGSLNLNAKSGYTGNLAYSISGLQAAVATTQHVGGDPSCNFNTANPDAMVAAGYATVTTFVTPPGASYIRFQTFASDAGAAAHDLDLFAYRATPAAGAPFVLAATSGGPDQNEVVNSTSVGGLAAGAKWRVYVHGCSVDAGGADATLFAWGLTAAASNPFSAVPASQAVTIGQVVPGTLSWAGLPAGNRYLGRVIYVDPGLPATGMAATTVAVSTR
jgi:hypothetical protein